MELIINRAVDTAHLWIINQIIHSWLDPVFITAVLFVIGFAVFKGVKWMIDNDHL